MTENKMFINEALSEAFLLYNKSKDNVNSLDYNSFMCSIIRMLILIYGKEILGIFENSDVVSFEKELLKYGYDKKEYDNFLLCIEKFYNFDKKLKNKPIKKKNKFFNLLQKYLIDMFLQKDKVEKVDDKTKEEFGNLLFTANSSNFYQKSYAVLVAYNPYEIYEYAKKNNIVGDGNEKNVSN